MEYIKKMPLLQKKPLMLHISGIIIIHQVQIEKPLQNLQINLTI